MVSRSLPARLAAAALLAALALSLTACQRIDRSAQLPEGSSSADQSAQEVLAPQPDASAPDQSAPDAGAPVPEEPQQVQPQAPAYDFSQPAPETAAVDDSWFDDVVFMGDSRTDGLRLYGGIPGADFIESTGITVFDVGTKQSIRIDGQKYTMMQALGLKQYGKVYVMLGVNELGYFNDQAFADAYSQMVDDIRAIQPNAVIYLQNLVSVNPEKCKANNQPYYVTNEKIAVYNDIIADIAEEKHAVLVDVNAALVDETGILPGSGTTDGVHFTKDYYVKWYDYLKIHTVDPDLYWAGQTAVAEEGA